MRLSSLLLVALVLHGCNNLSDERSLGLFEPNLISTDLYEFGSTFSPDGNLFFYTLSSPNYYIYEFTIVYSKKVNGKWTIPEVAPFSGTYSDRDPYFSPDGKYIYFSSMRPLSDSEKSDFDLWRVALSFDDFEFGAPENLGLAINTPFPEMSPAVDEKGNLYYSSVVPGNTFGSLDIYKSELVNGVFQKPENLGDSINSTGPDAYPHVSPDGNRIFFSSRREGGLGDMDIYYSEIDDNSIWCKGILLGEPINSKHSEISPFLFNKRLYFTSTRQKENILLNSIADWNDLSHSILNGNGNIYQISGEMVNPE